MCKAVDDSHNLVIRQSKVCGDEAAQLVTRITDCGGICIGENKDRAVSQNGDLFNLYYPVYHAIRKGVHTLIGHFREIFAAVFWVEFPGEQDACSLAPDGTVTVTAIVFAEVFLYPCPSFRIYLPIHLVSFTGAVG